jgi:hypothetical protein
MLVSQDFLRVMLSCVSEPSHLTCFLSCSTTYCARLLALDVALFLLHFQHFKCLYVDFLLYIAANKERIKKYRCLFLNLHGLPFVVSNIMQLDKPTKHIYFICFLG